MQPCQPRPCSNARLVGGPSAWACGSEKLVLQAFLLSIRLLRNSEHSNILEGATQGNDDVMRSLAQRSYFCFYTISLTQRSRFCFNRSTWVRTHKKDQETKHPFPSHTETEFCFWDTKTILSETPKLSISEMLKLSISETPKQNSVSTPLETKFCFHSTWNGILFPLHLKQNSTPLETEFRFHSTWNGILFPDYITLLTPTVSSICI